MFHLFGLNSFAPFVSENWNFWCNYKPQTTDSLSKPVIFTFGSGELYGLIGWFEFLNIPNQNVFYVCCDFFTFLEIVIIVILFIDHNEK